MKKVEKEKAMKLRISGYSLAEISKKIGISKSTASLWTKDVMIDASGLSRMEQKAKTSRLKGHTILHEKKLKRLEIASKEANDLIKLMTIDNDVELTALAMMYWCEGIKRDNGVAFTNSNPELVVAFVNLLKKIFNIDMNRIRMCLHVHDYHNVGELSKFWLSKIKIPKENLSIYRKKSNHKYINEGYKGCVRISYFDSHIARVIISFAKKFIRLYI